jgi:hydrogenase maturation protease
MKRRPVSAQILIAGIGNIFMGDDAFGVEVAQALNRRTLPEGVRVMDFGIRSYDLAYALNESYAAVILVDATPRGEAPGTTYLLQLDLDEPRDGEIVADPHSLDPVAVLRLARSFGTISADVYLVGCEPGVLETEQIGLSDPVRAAVPQAIALIEELVSTLRGSRNAAEAVGRPA